MSEVTRFRIARPPTAATSDSLNACSYPGPHDKSRFACTPGRRSYREVALQFLKDKAYIAAPVLLAPPCAGMPAQGGAPQMEQPPGKLEALVAGFLGWLEAVGGARARDACLDWLATYAAAAAPEGTAPAAAIQAIAASEEWKALRTAVGDSLIASIVTRGERDHIDYLTRLFRALSLVELLAANALPDALPTTIQRLGVFRFVLLPPEVPAAVRPDAPIFVRTPAFSDLIVVRQEWSCYVPGELAHIENVMKGESKVRTHERIEEVETKQEDETTTTNYEEHDTQTTDRQSLKEEAQQQTQLEIGVEGQVDTSGQYGPTRVNTHLGARLSYSVQESRQRALEQSREIVDRAVSRVETKVRELRSMRTLRRITETNKHTLDNTGQDRHAIGLYRWVDRIVRLQTFRYRHRFLLEFQIPEPAAHYRWVQKNAPAPAVLVEPAPPFHPDAEGDPLINPEAPLSPSHLHKDNYQYYAAKFGATGVVPPPDSEVAVSGATTLAAEGKPNTRDTLIEFAPHKSGKIELTVPHNYEAMVARVSIAGHPTLGNWHDQPEERGNGYAATSIGYHNITAAFTLSGQVQKLTSDAPRVTVRGDVKLPTEALNRRMEYYDAWTSGVAEIRPAGGGSLGTGKLDVGVVVGGAFEAIASVTLQCRLQATAYQAWQQETWDRLHEAWRTAADAYREAQITAQVRREESVAERSSLRNAEVVREELKRQVIEMLLRETFRGYDLRSYAQAGSPSDGPEAVQGTVTRLREAAAAAPLIQFLEQAFEWTNMTYIMYPYYWASDVRWRDLQMIEGNDADFMRFLRSGSARVIVPARPGFHHAVMYFSIYGEPWTGGVPPIPGDELYVSVAQEIQEMTGAPDEGEPVMLWEERLPTTLVWLDSVDTRLPRNEHSRLNGGTPQPNLCGDRV
ncbi:MAG: hypothetical protein U0X20_31970 [Caldilineaceae bacterium]